MNNEVIEVEKNKLGSREVLTVSARELHVKLEVKTRFNDWIDRRIEEYGFTENADYLVILKFEYNSKGGPKAKEYHVSLAMAKELALVENNEIGRAYRRKLIALEENHSRKQLGNKAEVESAITLKREFKSAYMSAGVGYPEADRLAYLKVKEMTGIDLPEALNLPTPRNHLLVTDSPQNFNSEYAQHFTPTYLGKILGISAQAFNRLLEKQGYFIYEGIFKVPTEKGKGLCIERPHNPDSGQNNQLLWKLSVLQLVSYKAVVSI